MPLKLFASGYIDDLHNGTNCPPYLPEIQGHPHPQRRDATQAGKVIGLERVTRDETTHMYKRL